MSPTDPRPALGLRRVINVNGPMTSLGASSAIPEAIEAAANILPHYVEINGLHRQASKAIARATGAEAGFVTASASAGITLSIAAAMTGSNLARVEQLPDTTDLKNEVPIQMGHMTGYGAPVEQGIRLAGAKPVPVGNVIDAQKYQLGAKINERTAAALYVISFHTVQYGQIPLDIFIETCHARNIPVIVDLANEHDMHSALAMGADIVLISAHKFLRGLTAGIVAGEKELVRATFLQNMGIGRGMKVGKEAIASTIAVLEAWAKKDHQSQQAQELAALKLWQEAFSPFQGVTAQIISDPTGNPIKRLRLGVDPGLSRTTAWDLAIALASGEQPIIIREEEVELGHFEMDPCHLQPGEAEIVANRVVEELQRAAKRNAPPTGTAADRMSAKIQSLLNWPD